MAKTQANTKLHCEALAFLNLIHILHPRYNSKIIGDILENKQKNKCVCIHTINHNENEDENGK